MILKLFGRALFALLVCGQLFAGRIALHANASDSSYVPVSPSNIYEPRPK